jgi:hypothetical protein
MGTLTSRLKLFKPAGSDSVDRVVDLNNNWDIVDVNTGAIICTSSTRPSGAALYAGLLIHETDTKLSYVYDGSSFILVGIPGFASQSVNGGPGQSLTTTQTDITGATVTFTTVRPNEKVRFQARYTIRQDAASTVSSTINFFLDGTDIAGNTGMTWLSIAALNGINLPLSGFALATIASAGSHTCKLRGISSINSSFTVVNFNMSVSSEL